MGHVAVSGLVRAPIERLTECMEEYGNVFRLDYGHIPTVWLCNYEQITAALKQDALQYRSHHLVPGMVGIWYASYVHTGSCNKFPLEFPSFLPPTNLGQSM